MIIIGYILLVVGPVLCVLTSKSEKGTWTKIAVVVVVAIALIVIGGLR